MTKRERESLVKVARWVGGGVAARKLGRVLSRCAGDGGSVKTKGKPGDKLTGKAKSIMNAARVRSPGEALSDKKFAVKAADGNPLQWGGRAVETSSERDKAVCGVFLKHTLRRLGLPVVLTEWDKALLAESVERDQWVGSIGSDYYGGGSPEAYVPRGRVKSLLDDSISGGFNVNPVVFDQSIITYPLLHGQLLPAVDLQPVTGRRILTPTVQNVSMQWGQSPGTAATPFNTASLISGLDTSVFGVAGFIEVSNELMADSPVQIGQTLIQLFGERLKNELDRVIAVGNGVTEPAGISGATGLVSLNTDNGIVGPPTVSDAESLIFAIPLAYRQPDLNPGYVMNDTSYRRYRGMQVGSDDQRRVFGMGTFGTEQTQQYMLFEYPVRVVNELPNSTQLFGCLKRYRLFQRLGMEVVNERGGRQLALTNMSLLGVRARFGGRVVDGAAFAKVSDAQE